MSGYPTMQEEAYEYYYSLPPWELWDLVEHNLLSNSVDTIMVNALLRQYKDVAEDYMELKRVSDKLKDELRSMTDGDSVN